MDIQVIKNRSIWGKNHSLQTTGILFRLSKTGCDIN